MQSSNIEKENVDIVVTDNSQLPPTTTDYSSGEDEDEEFVPTVKKNKEKKVYRRAMNTLDVAYVTGQGSFRPGCYLVNKGLMDPFKFIIDPNSGANFIHYAAHFGNVKCLKFLNEWNKKLNK